MGRVGRKRQHHSIRDVKRACKTKARKRDLDQIFEDMQKPMDKRVKPVDSDLPGMGQSYCTECARHFIDSQALERHMTTKAHKKRVKVLQNEKPYTQKEAEAAVGLFTDNGILN